MPVTVPPSVNYASPVFSLASSSQDEPTEGRAQVSLEITWGTMGGANKSVVFNLQGSANVRFSQISALKVDNSACGADVQFVFPDTGEVITIPGGTPLALVPVFSNSQTFYAIAAQATAEDVTRFLALNYAMDAAEVDAVLGASFSSSGNTQWVLPGPVTTTLAAAGVNGSLRSLLVVAAAVTLPTVALAAHLTLRDGAGTQFIPSWRIGVATNMLRIGGTFIVLQLDQPNIRFRNGLFLDWTVDSGGTSINFLVNTFATFTQP